MFQYILKTTLLVAGLSLLTACEGKNPLDRTNDPTKDYSNLDQSSSEYKQLENQELEQLKYENKVLKNEIAAQAKAQANSQSTCGRVYDMEIMATEGGRLDFVENTSKTYQVKVRSYLTEDFELKLEKAPEDSVRLSRSNEPGLWEITWQPSSGLISERESFYTGPLKIAFVPRSTDPKAAACLKNKFVEDFSVTVALDDTQPVLSIESSNQTLKSRDMQTVVRVQVTDPAATANRPPLVSPVAVVSSSNEKPVTNLISSCSGASAANTPQTWTYDCIVSFYPLMKQIEAANNGDVLNGVVAFKAISQRTGRSTPDVPKTLRIIVDEPSKVKPPVEPDQAPSTGIVPIPTPRPANP